MASSQLYVALLLVGHEAMVRAYLTRLSMAGSSREWYRGSGRVDSPKVDRCSRVPFDPELVRARIGVLRADPAAA